MVKHRNFMLLLLLFNFSSVDDDLDFRNHDRSFFTGHLVVDRSPPDDRSSTNEGTTTEKFESTLKVSRTLITDSNLAAPGKNGVHHGGQKEKKADRMLLGGRLQRCCNSICNIALKCRKTSLISKKKKNEEKQRFLCVVVTTKLETRSLLSAEEEHYQHLQTLSFHISFEVAFL